MNFPKHKAGLSLTHNEHKNYYESVEQFFESYSSDLNNLFVSHEQKTKAFETDELWTLEWYPETPIGSHILYAADLDILLETANKMDD